MPGIADYNPSKSSGVFPDQVGMTKKEEIMGRTAYQLPVQILNILDEYSTLDRNWVGIASEFKCVIVCSE